MLERLTAEQGGLMIDSKRIASEALAGTVRTWLRSGI